MRVARGLRVHLRVAPNGRDAVPAVPEGLGAVARAVHRMDRAAREDDIGVCGCG